MPDMLWNFPPNFEPGPVLPAEVSNFDMTKPTHVKKAPAEMVSVSLSIPASFRPGPVVTGEDLGISTTMYIATKTEHASHSAPTKHFGHGKPRILALFPSPRKRNGGKPYGF